MNQQERIAIEQRQRHNESIRRATTVNAQEGRQEQLARVARARKDYAYFVSYYFPHWCTDRRTGSIIPCAKFHVAAASYILSHTSARALFKWARGHAKSTHLTIFIPLWLKCQKQREIRNMVVVGKSEDSAMRLLYNLQSELENNERYIRDFGAQQRHGFWADGEFVTADDTHFVAIGRGQSPRGFNYKSARPDYIVIDDIDDDELCRNEKRVADLAAWVKEALFGTLDGNRGRFIMVGNLISKNSVLARMAATDGVHVTQVNIYDHHGGVSWGEKFAPEEVKEMERFMGYRAFQKEYMNNPLTEGAIFMQRHLRWGKILPLPQYRQLICYTDPSFKNSATADYKATMLAGKSPDGHFHLLRAYAAQCSVSEMVGWHYDVMQWVGGCVPVVYFMEANFMQDLMLDEFRKVGDALGLHVPIVGDRRSKGDKFARIEAMQPLFERGLVMFNEAERDSSGMGVLLDQLLSFERGARAHDDAPDALEAAIWMLSQRARTTANRYIVQPRPSRRW
jgi:predicted phage terminase large subunit-like protein